jgi:hypothetical protein
MDLDAVELSIALTDYFTIMILRYLLPEASQNIHHSAKNKITDEMAGGGTFCHRCILAEKRGKCLIVQGINHGDSTYLPATRIGFSGLLHCISDASPS